MEIQCIGHFKLLFCLLRLESHDKIQEMALHVLSNVTGSAECVDDIAASKVMGFVIQILYSLPEQRPLALTVLHALIGDSRLVKEVLANGGVVALVHSFCHSSDTESREKAAEVLAKMSADKLTGPKARIALSKFLPDIFLDAVKKSPETGVQMFESSHENPELIWNDETRATLTRVVGQLAERHQQHLRQNPDAAFVYDEAAIPKAIASQNELVISGIYIRLFIANPGWVLRRPREILTDLLETTLQLMQAGHVDLQRLEEVSTALLKLLSTQPALAEVVPATGYLSRIFSAMATADGTVIKAAVLIVSELSRSSACIENMATCNNCVKPMTRALKQRQDLVGVCCDAFARIFSGHHDSLVKQALDANLVQDLLGFLEKTPGPDPETRALIVKALKSMEASLTHGERVAAILKANPIWAQYAQQRHDLFIKSDSGVAGALTNQAPPGVAGYLTSSTASKAAASAPSLPPPIDSENLHNPVDNNPLL